MRFSENLVDCPKICHGDYTVARAGIKKRKSKYPPTILNLTCPGKNAYDGQFCIELN